MFSETLVRPADWGPHTKWMLAGRLEATLLASAFGQVHLGYELAPLPTFAILHHDKPVTAKLSHLAASDQFGLVFDGYWLLPAIDQSDVFHSSYAIPLS